MSQNGIYYEAGAEVASCRWVSCLHCLWERSPKHLPLASALSHRQYTSPATAGRISIVTFYTDGIPRSSAENVLLRNIDRVVQAKHQEQCRPPPLVPNTRKKLSPRDPFASIHPDAASSSPFPRGTKRVRASASASAEGSDKSKSDYIEPDMVQPPPE